MGQLGNIKIEPMVVTWGADVAQVSTITCVADVADSLDGDYFFLYTPGGVKHYFWFNTSGGSASDPSIAGATAHAVAITTGDTAAAVAIALEAVIEATTGFDSTVSSGVVTVTNSDVGYAPGPYEGVGTGFSFAVTTQGDTAADIGFVDGDIEVSQAEDLVEIKGHETGSNVLGHIRTGKQVEITLTFQETSAAQLRKLFIQGGNAFTPAGAAATEVHGWGFTKDFTQTMNQAKKLVLHPKVLGSGDRSLDRTYWKAYPMLESIAFSGENKLVVPVTFKIYPDTSKNAYVQYFAVGDGTQTLT